MIKFQVLHLTYTIIWIQNKVLKKKLEYIGFECPHM
jgi:hypothetical protein